MFENLGYRSCTVRYLLTARALSLANFLFLREEADNAILPEPNRVDGEKVQEREDDPLGEKPQVN